MTARNEVIFTVTASSLKVADQSAYKSGMDFFGDVMFEMASTATPATRSVSGTVLTWEIEYTLTEIV